tara:strand:- start:606 stop:950 length:345 start_codon:yes stop_codon:yes gene_type:complete
MATRCNIKITDQNDTLWFYRHSDGYPESVLPSLAPLMAALRAGQLRDNVGQFSGWLVVIGNKEYNRTRALPNGSKSWNAWKCGAYEPTTEQHGDIDYMYHIDLQTHELDWWKVS